MKLQHRLFASLPLVATVLLAGCMSGEAQDAPAAPPAPEVTTAEVLVQELRDWADFTGRLEAVESVELRARVDGYIESVHFEEGGRVEKGDLLFQIDARPLEAEVARLNAELKRAKAQLTLAQSQHERGERLLAQNAVSREEFDGVESSAAVASATLAAVQAALESAQLNLSFTHVTAPIAGRVSRAFVTAGNLVDDSTLLTTLVSDDSVYAYFDADEHTFLEHVSRPSESHETAVHVGLINEEGYPHTARLDFIDNQVDPEHGTIRVRAVLDNPDGKFTPGLFARLKLISPSHHEAALVDDRAIGTDLGHKFVFVLDDQNVVQYREVQTGRIVDGLRVVTAGLNTGDIVVVNGLQRVRPGVTVAATQVAMGRPSTALARVSTEQADEAQFVRNVR